MVNEHFILWIKLLGNLSIKLWISCCLTILYRQQQHQWPVSTKLFSYIMLIFISLKRHWRKVCQVEAWTWLIHHNTITGASAKVHNIFTSHFIPSNWPLIFLTRCITIRNNGLFQPAVFAAWWLTPCFL